MRLKESTKLGLTALLAAVVCCAILGLVFGSHAAESPAAQSELSDAQQMRTAVGDFLGAMKAGKSAAIYEMVPYHTREVFGSAGALTRALAGEYPMLVSHTAVVFGPIRTIKGDPCQLVMLVDSKKVVWMAAFVMQREAYAWRVAGVAVEKMDPPGSRPKLKNEVSASASPVSQ